jgi:hypothetical protein
MNKLCFGHYAFSSCIAAAMLAGCGGSQPPIGAPGAMPQASTIAKHAAHKESWMLPEAKSRDLLYVVDGGGDVDVLTYPGYRLVGTLTGFAESTGVCTDSQGNVWIADDFTSSLVEYSHGGTTPIATLDDPDEYPFSCSFDPKSGDLAVSNIPAASGGPNIAIYAHEMGPPVLYPDAKISEIFYLSYGPSSQLFFDGTSGNNYAMGRLHNGTFTKIRVRGARIYNGPQIAGGVQYARGMLTTTSIGGGRQGSGAAAVIYRMTDSGVIKGSTLLFDTYNCDAYLIWKDIVICPSGDYTGLLIYPYPRGGNYMRKVALHCCGIQVAMSVGNSESHLKRAQAGATLSLATSSFPAIAERYAERPSALEPELPEIGRPQSVR